MIKNTTESIFWRDMESSKPWIYDFIDEDTGDLIIECKECMTSMSFQFTQKEQDDMDKNIISIYEDKYLLKKIKKYIKTMRKDHTRSWNKFGYCGSMFLDWCDEFYKLERFDNSYCSIIKNYISGIIYKKNITQKDRLYKYMYIFLKTKIPKMYNSFMEI